MKFNNIISAVFCVFQIEGEFFMKTNFILLSTLFFLFVFTQNVFGAPNDWQFPYPNDVKYLITQGPTSTHQTANTSFALDFDMASGSEICAPTSGIIERANSACTTRHPGVIGDCEKKCVGYGTYIFLNTDDGYKIVFAHLSSLNVTKGQRVERGEILGLSGNTGNTFGLTGDHLHFEVRVKYNSIKKMFGKNVSDLHKGTHKSSNVISNTGGNKNNTDVYDGTADNQISSPIILSKENSEKFQRIENTDFLKITELPESLKSKESKSVNIKINNSAISNDIIAYIDSDNRAMIPIASINKLMGEYDFENVNIIVQIENDILIVDNNGTKTQIEISQNHIPIRFIAESLGFNVDWNNNTRTVLLTK